MGLDFVELIMRTEETFGISIPDKEAEKLETVDKLYHYVLNKIETAHEHACLTSFMFYRIRRALMEQFGLARGQIRPDRLLEDLIPQEERREKWNALGKKLDLTLPALEPPAGYMRYVNLSGLVILLGGIATACFSSATNHWGALMILGALAGPSLLKYLLTPYATKIPVDCSSVGALTRYLFSRHFGKISKMSKKWTDSDVWEALKIIIVEELAGLKPEDVVPQARFYEDLGAG